MKLALTTNFNCDADNEAKIWFLRLSEDGEPLVNEPVALVEIDYSAKHHIRYTDLGLNVCAVTQAKLMLAAAELIDSFFTGEDSVAEVEV